MKLSASVNLPGLDPRRTRALCVWDVALMGNASKHPIVYFTGFSWLCGATRLSGVCTHTDSRKKSTPDELAAVAKLLHGWIK